MKISELVQWLYSLSDVPKFEMEIRKMISFYEGDIVERIDSQKAKFKVAERNLTTGEYEFTVTSIEDEIIHRTKTTVLNQANNIVPEIDQSEYFIESLNIAEKIAGSESYYNNFPKYFEALELTKEAIRDTVNVLDVKKEKRGNPNFEGLTISQKVKIISLADTLLHGNSEYYKAKKGAFVSEILKSDVFDKLETEIPDLSIHKVRRVLIKHYRTKKD